MEKQELKYLPLLIIASVLMFIGLLLAKKYFKVTLTFHYVIERGSK